VDKSISFLRFVIIVISIACGTAIMPPV